MTLSSFSDIIVSFTLIINALALTPNPPPANGGIKGPEDSENASLLAPEIVAKNNEEVISIGQKIKEMFQHLRRFSFILVLWNVFFMLAMLLIFDD